MRQTVWCNLTCRDSWNSHKIYSSNWLVSLFVLVLLGLGLKSSLDLLQIQIFNITSFMVVLFIQSYPSISNILANTFFPVFYTPYTSRFAFQAVLFKQDSLIISEWVMSFTEIYPFPIYKTSHFIYTLELWKQVE